MRHEFCIIEYALQCLPEYVGVNIAIVTSVSLTVHNTSIVFHASYFVIVYKLLPRVYSDIGLSVLFNTFSSVPISYNHDVYCNILLRHTYAHTIEQYPRHMSYYYNVI